MKAAYIPVLTALLGLTAATPEKRRNGVQCVGDGPPLDGPGGCKALVKELRAAKGDDELLRIPGDGNNDLWGCGHGGCGIRVYPKYGELIIGRSALSDDIEQIIDQCPDNGFVGTFTEESGEGRARRTEVFNNEALCKAN